MTTAAVATETTYTLTGSALGPFNSVWTCEGPSNLAVWLDAGSGPALVSSAEYTVAPPASYPGALAVTLNTALLPTGGAWGAVAELTLQRLTSQDQPTSFAGMTSFQPAVFEAALDHVERQVQELQTAMTRTLRQVPGAYPNPLPPPETLDAMWLTFDSHGNPQAGIPALAGASYTPPTIAADTLMGNETGTSAQAVPLTGTQAATLLPAMTGDAGSGGAKGLVPAPPAGAAAANEFLRADGNWEPAGYLGAPVDAEAAAYSLSAADNGRTKYFTASETVTIPVGLAAPAAGNLVFDLTCNTGVTLTVTPASGVTLVWPAGAGATGARTVTGYGAITLQQMAVNVFWVRGAINVT